MKTVFFEAIKNSYSYDEYRKIVFDLIITGKSSGEVQSKELTHYSFLNHTRMQRLDKTILISVETTLKLESLKNEYIWLVIAESWCGDAAQLLPIFNKMAGYIDKTEMRIVFRDANINLMNLFLTDGTKSIPKLIILDKNTLEIKAHWGPRPKGAIELVKKYIKKLGEIDDYVKTELQMWYLHDKGIGTQKELTEVLLEIENDVKM